MTSGEATLTQRIAGAAERNIADEEQRAAFYREMFATFDDFGIEIFDLIERDVVDPVLFRVWEERSPNG